MLNKSDLFENDYCNLFLEKEMCCICSCKMTCLVINLHDSGFFVNICMDCLKEITGKEGLKYD